MVVLSKLAPQFRITMDECYRYERPEVKKQDGGMRGSRVAKVASSLYTLRSR